MRFLLKSLYRDLYRYKKIEHIRKQNSDSIDIEFIESEFEKDQRRTRFLGVGNPSESGVHLLYFFRQENKIAKDLFINSDEIFNRQNSSVELALPNVNEYVFIDDFCGSGTQAKIYSDNIVRLIKKLNPDLQVSYLMLFSTKEGRRKVKDNTLFDSVETVFEMDSTFKCFDTNSRFFRNVPPEIDQEFAKKMCSKYGKELYKSIIRLSDRSLPDLKLDQLAEFHKLGYRDCQLLIGFHHNTPDNSLPILWYDETEIPWKPIFKRYNKKYGT